MKLAPHLAPINSIQPDFPLAFAKDLQINNVDYQK